LIQRVSARTRWSIILLESNVQRTTQKMKTTTKMKMERVKEKELMVKPVVKVVMMERGRMVARPWRRRKVMKTKMRQIMTRNHPSPLHF